MKKIFIMFISLFTIIPLCVKGEVLDKVDEEVKQEDTKTLASNAKSAILIKESTGEILYEYNSHEKLEPASMTKFMTT